MASKDQLWVKVVLVIAFLILASIGSVIVLEGHQYYIKVPTSGYSESGSYVVKDNLEPNPLYNATYLENPKIVYNSITSSLNISIEAFIQLNNMSGTDVSILSEVTLVSSSPSWAKLINTTITDRKVSGNGDITVPVEVNLSSDLSLAQSIDSKLQDGSTDPVIDLNMSIEAPGLNAYSTSMSIALHTTYEDLSYGPSNPASFTSFKQELVVPHTLIGLGIIYGYILLGGAGATGIAMAVLYAPRITDPVEKLRKEQGDQIIEIETPPSEDAKKLMKLEDLLKISEIFETPVFLYAPDKVLYVKHQDDQFKYELL